MNRARTELGQAQDHLKENLPLPSISRLALMVLVLLVFGLLPWLRPGIAAGDALLSDDMVKEAQNQGADLVNKIDVIKSMKGLSEEEKEEVKKLQEMVKAASEELSKSDGKSAREVLEALEERARPRMRSRERYLLPLRFS